MKTSTLLRRALASWQAAAALTLLGGSALAAHIPIFGSYNADSDILGVAHETDTRLVNPWGIAITPDLNIRVSDDGTGYTTTYAPGGNIISGTGAAVIPSVTGTGPGAPTGIAENEEALLKLTDSNDFDIASTTGTAPAHYIYGTEDGAIVGYRAIVSDTTGIVAVDGSAAGAGYTGVTLSWVIGASGTLEHTLYAANFRQGKVDVFNSSFQDDTANLTTISGTTPFVTPIATGTFNSVVYNYSPFNVKAVDFYAKNSEGKNVLQRRVLVAYALQSATNSLDDVAADGYGYIATFQPDGALDRVLISPGHGLDSPWGMAFSHHQFVNFRSPAALLVGNHGSGLIKAYAFAPDLPPLPMGPTWAPS